MGIDLVNPSLKGVAGKLQGYLWWFLYGPIFTVLNLTQVGR